MHLLIVASVGDGAYYCINIQDDTDGAVVIYQPGLPFNQKVEVAADDFGVFFRDQVFRELRS